VSDKLSYTYSELLTAYSLVIYKMIPSHFAINLSIDYRNCTGINNYNS